MLSPCGHFPKQLKPVLMARLIQGFPGCGKKNTCAGNILGRVSRKEFKGRWSRSQCQEVRFSSQHFKNIT